MNSLVPVDGSDCSFRALEHALGLTEKYDGTLTVVHITDHRTDATERLIDRAETAVAEHGRDATIEVYTDLPKFRRANRIGKVILEIADEEAVDHIVMGHHGTGHVGRAILGSAATTVVRAAERPACVIP